MKQNILTMKCKIRELLEGEKGGKYMNTYKLPGYDFLFLEPAAREEIMSKLNWFDTATFNIAGNTLIKLIWVIIAGILSIFSSWFWLLAIPIIFSFFYADAKAKKLTDKYLPIGYTQVKEILIVARPHNYKKDDLIDVYLDIEKK